MSYQSAADRYIDAKDEHDQALKALNTLGASMRSWGDVLSGTSVDVIIPDAPLSPTSEHVAFGYEILPDSWMSFDEFSGMLTRYNVAMTAVEAAKSPLSDAAKRVLGIVI